MGTIGKGHDYLGALGLDLSAPFLSKLTPDEVLSVCSHIRKILMMKFHPDKWGGASESEQRRIAELAARINQSVAELESRESEDSPRLIDELADQARKPQKGKFAKLKDRAEALEAELNRCVYRRNLWAIAQCTSVIKGEYGTKVSALNLPECDILMNDEMEDYIKNVALMSRDWALMERQHPPKSFFIQVGREAGKVSIRQFSAERAYYNARCSLPPEATPAFSFKSQKTAYYWKFSAARRMEWKIIGGIWKPKNSPSAGKEAVVMYNRLLTGNSGTDAKRLEAGYTYEQFLPWLQELDPFLGDGYWLVGMRITDGQRMFRPLGIVSKIVLKDNGS